MTTKRHDTVTLFKNLLQHTHQPEKTAVDCQQSRNFLFI